MRRRLKTHEHSRMNPLFAENHRLNAFTRFEFFPEMLLVAQVNSTPHFIQNALDFFTHRFPPLIIAFFNSPTRAIFVKSNRKDYPLHTQQSFENYETAVAWLRNIVQTNIADRLEFKLKWSPLYFERFFETQFIKRRQNSRLQKKLMPLALLDKQSVEYQSMQKYYRNTNNTTLAEFFFNQTPIQQFSLPPPSKPPKGYWPKNIE